MRARLTTMMAACTAAAGTLASWLLSGRPACSSSSRNVEVQVPNELFGGTDVVIQSQPGPVFGYYIGLDLVLGVAAMAMVLIVAALVLGRRRTPRPAPGIHGLGEVTR